MIVWQNPSLRVLKEEREGVPTLTLSLSKVPEQGELEGMLDAVARKMKTTRCVLYLHAEAETQPPNLLQMMAIVGKVLEIQEAAKEKCIGVLVHGTRIDDLLLSAKEAFLSLYKPSCPFDVVTKEEEVAAFFVRIRGGGRERVASRPR